MLGPGYPHVAQCAGLDRLDRRRSRRRTRRHLPDARDHLAGGERVRRRRRRPCRARALSGGAAGHRAAARRRDPRRRQDRAADAAGLSDRAALRALRGRRLLRLLHRHRLAARPRIFRAGRDAVPFARGSQGDAQAPMRRPCSPPAVHRRVRVDPDRQPGDAAVRHGLHGPHAQAAERPAAGTDRAGAEDECAGGVRLQPSFPGMPRSGVVARCAAVRASMFLRARGVPARAVHASRRCTACRDAA